MRTLWILSLSLLVGCHATAPRLRRPQPARALARSDASRTPSGSPRRVSFALRDASVDEALAVIGRQVGRNIVAAPGIPDRITLTLRDVPWTVALHLVLERSRCEVCSTGEVLYVTQPPRVTLQF